MLSSLQTNSLLMRILGIDPGTSIIGFGIIDFDGENYSAIDFGTITTSAKLNAAKKLQSIIHDLKTLVQQNHPDCTSIEKLYFNKNVTTAISVAESRGAIIHFLATKNLPISEFTPLQIKSAVSGYGRASKSQVQEMVKILLNLKTIPKPDDAADALAIAICHAHHNQHPN